MNLWADFLQSQKSGRSIICRADHCPAFQETDYRKESTPVGDIFWLKFFQLNEPDTDLTLDIQTILYEFYFQNWQHYHTSQSECYLWFKTYLTWKASCLGFTRLKHLFPSAVNLISTNDYCSITLSEPYALGKNSVLGKRILTNNHRHILTLHYKTRMDYRNDQTKRREETQVWLKDFGKTLHYDIHFAQHDIEYSFLNSNEKAQWLGRASGLSNSRAIYFATAGTSSMERLTID